MEQPITKMKNNLTPKRAEEIAEELRCTRYKGTNKIAVEYIYNKYKDEFASYDAFLKIMQVASVFFASRWEQTQKDRDNTAYTYVEKMGRK